MRPGLKVLKILATASGMTVGIALIAVGVYAWIIFESIKESRQNVYKLCSGFRPGATFSEPEEETKIKSLGLDFYKVPNERFPSEFQLSILSKEPDPVFCDLRIRNGKILSAK